MLPTNIDMHDTQGACRLRTGLIYFVPRLKIIWADNAYRGKALADWRNVQTSETLIELAMMASYDLLARGPPAMANLMR